MAFCRIPAEISQVLDYDSQVPSVTLASRSNYGLLGNFVLPFYFIWDQAEEMSVTSVLKPFALSC